MYEYEVKVSDSMKIRVQADTAKDAKEQAWAEIADGYRYGWESKSQFLRMAKAERVY